MLTIEMKKELFKSNLALIEEIVEHLSNDIENAKNCLNDESFSAQQSVCGAIVDIIDIPNKVEQIKNIQNVLLAVKRS